MGVFKVWIIGGELLLWIDVVEIVWCIKVVDGINDVLIIINGLFLVKLVKLLKEVGLDWLNISLDMFKVDWYKKIMWGGNI